MIDKERMVNREEVTKLIERLRTQGVKHPQQIWDWRNEAANALSALLEANCRYRSCLWWLVGGGEFSHWFINSGVTLPVAAMREWEEARQCFPELLVVDDEPTEQQDGGINGECAAEIHRLEAQLAAHQEALRVAKEALDGIAKHSVCRTSRHESSSALTKIEELTNA